MIEFIGHSFSSVTQVYLRYITLYYTAWNQQNIFNIYISNYVILGGKAFTVHLTNEATKQPIPSDMMESMVNKLGLSQFKSKMLFQSLRKFGVKMEPNMEATLNEKSKMLSKFYVVKQITMGTKHSSVTEGRDLVFVEDLPAFLQFVAEYRGQDLSKSLIRVGIDSG